jgi:hypothetical protein
VDEHEKLVLLAGQHRIRLRQRGPAGGQTESEQNLNKCIRSSYVRQGLMTGK